MVSTTLYISSLLRRAREGGIESERGGTWGRGWMGFIAGEQWEDDAKEGEGEDGEVGLLP